MFSVPGRPGQPAYKFPQVPPALIHSLRPGLQPLGRCVYWTAYPVFTEQGGLVWTGGQQMSSSQTGLVDLTQPWI